MGQVSSATSDSSSALYLRSPSRLNLSSLAIHCNGPAAHDSSCQLAQELALLTITNDRKTGLTCKSHTNRLVEFVQVGINVFILRNLIYFLNGYLDNLRFFLLQVLMYL